MAESTNKPIMNLPGGDAHPVHAAGAKGVNQRIGTARIVMGASGLVATTFGYPGLGATRLQKGLYDLRFPQAQQTEIFAQIHTPSGGTAGMSGLDYKVAIGGQYGRPTYYQHGEHTSGIAQLYVKAVNANGSGLSTPSEPEEGAVVSLLIMQSPSNAY